MAYYINFGGCRYNISQLSLNVGDKIELKLFVRAFDCPDEFTIGFSCDEIFFIEDGAK